MAGELGHLSAEISLDINPFLNNQRALETQINRTGKLLTEMERSFKGVGSSVSGNSIFKTQVAQLGMLSKQLDNYRTKFDAAKKDLAANPTVDNQRALGTVATQLQTTALKYDTLRLSAAQALQQQRQASTIFGQGASAIGDYGNKLQSIGQGVRNFGSSLGTGAISGGLYNAAQAAMSFKSQIQNIGPLLSDDGRITAQVTQQLNQMSQSSLKWSQQYGISTQEINNAMTELVRRGFTAQQTLGSMPAILNATRASGESIGVVMQASASAIEMFGLKANSTAEQIKNTNRVTDVLTVAANKTASSFADISAAMTYVGPTASQAHMSIEQVAAAIGALSNKGIEASTAGTTLRQVLSKLTTDTKANRANMQAIGVDIDEIKKKGVDLPSLIDHINEKLKDKTPTEKMALLNAAFGKLGQGVMALFEKSNKSSKSAGDELRQLEIELEHAGGTTKRIANEMNQTPQAKWEQFKQTMHATMIEIGGNVLPAFQSGMKVIQGLAQAFSKLPPAQQQAIANMLMLVAAIKPLTAAVGAPIEGIGKLMNGFKQLYTWGAKLRGGSIASALKAVDEAAGHAKNVGTLAKGLKEVGDAASKTTAVKDTAKSVMELGSATTGSANKARSLTGVLGKLAQATTTTAEVAPAAASATAEVGTAAASAATGSATLLSSLASLGVGLGVVASAAVVGYGAFKVWQTAIHPAISSMIEHGKETALWGVQVGKQTSDASAKFKNFASQATQAMNAAETGIKGNADNIKSAFNGMAKTAQDNADKTDSALRKLAKDIGGTAGASIDESRKSNNSRNSTYLKSIQEDQKLANTIIENAAKQGGKMSDDTRQMLNNIQSDITSNFVKTLGTTKTASAHIQQAIEGTFKGKLSADQEMSRLREFDKAYQEVAKHTQDSESELKSAYSTGQLTYGQYIDAKKKLARDDYENMVSLGEGQINLMRHQGDSWKEIKETLKADGNLTNSEINAAISRVRDGSKQLDTILADTSGKVSKNAKKAGDAWNKLVFDPKTGKIKTNAQEAINDFAKTDKGWKQLNFIMKHAKINSDAKKMIIEAMFASGKWNSLSFDDQYAYIQSNAGKTIAEALYMEEQWNNADPKIQELIATAPNQEAIIQALTQLKNWNLLTPDQKKLIINSVEGADKLRLELMEIKEWNELPDKERKLVTKTIQEGGDIKQVLEKLHLWNKLPESMQKEIRVIDAGTGHIDETKEKLKGLDSMKVMPKVNVHVDSPLQKIQKVNDVMNGLNGKTASTKWSFQTGAGIQNLNQVKTGIKALDGKTSTSHVDVTGIPKLVNGIQTQKQFNATPSSSKQNSQSNTGADQVQDGTNKQKAFNGQKASSKNNHMSASGRDQVQDGTNKQSKFNSTPHSDKKNHISTSGTKELGSAIGQQNTFMGLHGHDITNTITTVKHVIDDVGNKVKGFFGFETGTAGAWRFKHFAYGTPNDGWQGGPVIVGDGHRREVVYEPQYGALYTTPATDTLMNLSKGSVIWRSVEAFESAMEHAGIRDYPKFAYGTAGQNMVALADRIPDNADEQLRALSKQQNDKNNNSNELQMQTNELIAMLVEQNQQLISVMQNLGFSFNVDGKKFADAQAEPNSKAINQYLKQTGMRLS